MRKRTATIAIASAACVAAAYGLPFGDRDRPGAVDVSRSSDGKRLWHREVDGGFVVVLAVTQKAAAIADGDDCIHGGSAEIEIVTQNQTSPVASVPGCVVFRLSTSDLDAIRLERPVEDRGHLVAVLPPTLGARRVRLPCPCPRSSTGHIPSGYWVVRGPGVFAIPRNGTFVAGAD